jgi:hypothetical protein
VAQAGATLSTFDKVAAFRAAFWKFLRPHTIRGTILGATSVATRAALENQHVRPPPPPPGRCLALPMSAHAADGLPQSLSLCFAALCCACKTGHAGTLNPKLTLYP